MAGKQAMLSSETHHSLTEARAYSIWEAEGRPHGHDVDHWLKAEAEVTASLTATPARKTRRSSSGSAAPRKKAPSAAKKTSPRSN